jgi:hypothetical protein
MLTEEFDEMSKKPPLAPESPPLHCGGVKDGAAPEEPPTRDMS